MLAMHNIKPKPGSKQKAKRIGRGNASGTGTYSGKGLKGQKARSGVSNLKRLGMKKQLQQTPKVRGFKSLKPKNQVISVTLINKNYKDEEIVNLESLVAKNLIKNTNLPVKILGKEKLKVKVKLEGVLASQSVKDQL
jgi:large subunit ribosomal protein L15